MPWKLDILTIPLVLPKAKGRKGCYSKNYWYAIAFVSLDRLDLSIPYSRLCFHSNIVCVTNYYSRFVVRFGIDQQLRRW